MKIGSVEIRGWTESKRNARTRFHQREAETQAVERHTFLAWRDAVSAYYRDFREGSETVGITRTLRDMAADNYDSALSDMVMPGDGYYRQARLEIIIGDRQINIWTPPKPVRRTAPWPYEGLNGNFERK